MTETKVNDDLQSIHPPTSSSRLPNMFNLKYPIDLGGDKESYAAVFQIYDVQGATIADDKNKTLASHVGTASNVGAIGLGAGAAMRLIDGVANNRGYNYLQALGLGVSAVAVHEAGSVISKSLSEQRTNDIFKGSVSMYMPTKLVTGYNFGWDTADLSMLRALGGGAMNLADSLNGGGSDPQSAQAYREFFAREVGQEAIENMLGRTSGGSIRGINIASFTDARTRTVRNPYLQYLFRSVTPRQFEFDFTLSPRNPKEAKEIQDIIYAFKFYSHPSLTDNEHLYLTYPAQFEISFLNLRASNGAQSRMTTINRVAKCVCTGVTVDYTGHGEGVSMIENRQNPREDHPSQIQLTLTFDETVLLNRKDINEDF